MKTFKNPLGWASGAGLFLFSSALAFADPAGMAAHVKGPVEAGGKPVKLLQRLEPGTQVKVGAGGEAVIVLFGNGARYKVGAGQTATVNANAVAGGQKMADLGGPSAGVVQMLGGSRVGAVVSRVGSSLQRLIPDSPGYLETGLPQFIWQPSTGGKSYTFTLFDAADNILWSTRTDATSAAYPATAMALVEKRPYLWRITAFGASGKPVESRSGLITILTPADAAQVRDLETNLRAQAKATGDSTPLLLLADTYRTYGMAGKALEVLDELSQADEPGVDDARADVYATLSPLTRVWAGQAVER